MTTHSPADVIRRLLIQLTLGTDPAAGEAWPVYAEGEPPTPDNVITVYTTGGVDSPRTMPDGDSNGTVGFQVRVRSVDHATGFLRASLIADTITAADSVRRVTVAVGGYTHLVHSVDYVSNVTPLGKESPNSRRNLFTVNAQAMIDNTGLAPP